MYASIRSYRFGDEVVRDAVRLAKESMIPLMRQVPGFVAYYVIAEESGELTVVNLYDEREGAEEASRVALEWVRDNLPAPTGGLPEIGIGRVIVAEGS